MLHVLEDLPHVSSAIHELARIARPGAPVFVGEVPFVDEQRSLKSASSALGKLFGNLKYNLQDVRRAGIRDIARRTLQYLVARLGKNRLFIIHPKRTIHISREEIVRFASAAALDLVFERPHVGLDVVGHPLPSASRMDYLFRKRSQG
jgi:hypothetical protein